MNSINQLMLEYIVCISVLKSKFMLVFIFSLQGRGLAEMKMTKPKLTITPPPNAYNPYSLDLLSKLKDDLAIIGKLKFEAEQDNSCYYFYFFY